ncbi:MAG: Peptidase M23 [Berkelbacteria bacterium GW2011_GWA2_35_9]|uniref:Peptidase M23 n=1 Tax=Berkelbacteria bacterium GW2011_GWA2_35_9 TaxID=1618333 RepID=A0A0G0DKC5_9BACT|nr:MAG: Peptidase M23 [Berkelbacteria bacterium GW2011_GWA2_35_9]
MTKIIKNYTAKFTKFFYKEIWHDNLGLGFTKQTLTVLILSFIVLLFNFSKNKVLAQDKTLLEVGNSNSVALISEIQNYTSFIDENPDELIEYLEGTDRSYIEKPSIGDTIESPYKYTVSKGETLSQIAEKFNLHVATILEANDLSPSESENISPGTTLTIPPYDTDVSMAWLDEVNRIKEEKERLARIEEEKKKREAEIIRQKNLAKLKSSSKQTASSSYNTSSGPGGYITPISSKGISRGISRGHTGIDYRADVGTPVVASGGGQVIEITNGWSGGWGISVVLSHGGGITTRYAHLSKISVGIGQTVSAGSLVGYSGNTGFSTGPHLHFEMRSNGSVVYPFK